MHDNGWQHEKKQKKSMMANRILILLVTMLGAMRQVHCKAHETAMQTPTNVVAATATASTQGESFDIPPSLIHRMTMAHNAALNRLLKTNFGPYELFAWDGRGGKFPNVYVIAARPRGEMKFCDDRLDEKEREKLWPFDVEAFEKSLEVQMVRDNDGRFRFKVIVLSMIAWQMVMIIPGPPRCSAG